MRPSEPYGRAADPEQTASPLAPHPRWERRRAAYRGVDGPRDGGPLAAVGRLSAAREPGDRARRRERDRRAADPRQCRGRSLAACRRDRGVQPLGPPVRRDDRVRPAHSRAARAAGRPADGRSAPRHLACRAASRRQGREARGIRRSPGPGGRFEAAYRAAVGEPARRRRDVQDREPPRLARDRALRRHADRRSAVQRGRAAVGHRRGPVANRGHRVAGRDHRSRSGGDPDADARYAVDQPRWQRGGAARRRCRRPVEGRGAARRARSAVHAADRGGRRRPARRRGLRSSVRSKGRSGDPRRRPRLGRARAQLAAAPAPAG